MILIKLIGRPLIDSSLRRVSLSAESDRKRAAVLMVPLSGNHFAHW